MNNQTNKKLRNPRLGVCSDGSESSRSKVKVRISGCKCEVGSEAESEQLFTVYQKKQIQYFSSGCFGEEIGTVEIAIGIGIE